MTPNAEFYKPTTEYADKLISQIGQTPSWIAKRIGVTDKRIRYILDGERTVKGDTTPIQMTYTEQFALECLAAAAKARPHPRTRRRPPCPSSRAEPAAARQPAKVARRPRARVLTVAAKRASAIVAKPSVEPAVRDPVIWYVAWG